MDQADVDFKVPPRRRIGAVVLVRDRQNRVLLVKPTYGDEHQLPGGGAQQFETPAEAATRELMEETGLVRKLTHFVALDYVPFNHETEVAEGLNIVVDGGTLTDEQADAVAIPKEATGELESFAWVWPNELDDYTAPYQARRIRRALSAIEHGKQLPLLVLGAQSAA